MTSHFEFWLRTRGDSENANGDQNDSSLSTSFLDRTRKQRKDAHKKLNGLDRRYGSKVRQQMWTNDEQTKPL
jgi:hypothetical protein